MDLQRVGFKFFVENSASVELPEFIEIFHRWIQTQALDGLLIDVADYEHVHHGPGIMLIAHEGNYAMDTAHGRMGLLYMRKQPAAGPLAERLAAICRLTLQACRLLEAAPEIEGRITFRGNEFVLIANDRLLAPNTQETAAMMQPAIATLLAQLYGTTACTQSREPDARALFTLTIKAPQAVTTSTLLERLGA